MVTISLCMIVKNEETVLSRCLDSIASLVDEIIIVDTGSTDKTKSIAAKYTTHIYSFSWIDDFSAARNYSFSKATMDYCMWIDADDVLDGSQKEAFLQLKSTLMPDTDIVMMKYVTAFDSEGNPTFSYFRERWILNNKSHSWVGQVHEVITPDGKVAYSDIAISHKKSGTGDPDRNLRIYQKLLDDKKTLDPRQQYYYGRELYYHNLYQEAASALQQFLSMPDGWVENKIEACSVCANCYYALGQDLPALLVLLRSLTFDCPRAEICCDIGSHFMNHDNYEVAAYWYKTAANLGRNDKTGGFIRPDCYDYIPFLQLCVCYDRLGDIDNAKMYNDKAGICKPDSKPYLFNRHYFESLSC